MVRKIFSFFSKEIKGVHEAAYLLGFFAFLSHLLALVRDRILAYHFGAGQTLDMYYAAFRVPDFIFAIVASLVSASVLIPFLSEVREKGDEETRDFLNTVFTVFVSIIGGVSLIAFFLMPFIIHRLFPGFTQSNILHQVIFLSRLLLLQPIFLGISNLYSSITQSMSRFFVSALSPIVYNLGIILGVIFLYPIYGLTGIVLGVVTGGIFHALVQFPFVHDSGFLPRLTRHIKLSSFKALILLSIPRTITLAAGSIEILIITGLASYMVPGSISIFNLAINLQSVPYTIIGISYSLAAFPTLAKLVAKGEQEKFVEHMIVAAKHIIFWCLPILTLFIVLRAHIVRVVLGSGQFSWNDTRLTAAALALFVVSLVPQGLELLFIRGYYALGNTLKPLVINLISSVITILLPYVFVYIFDHSLFFQFFIERLLRVEDVSGVKVLMLPLGYSLGTFTNTIIFWYFFEKQFKGFSKTVFKTLWQSLSAAVIAGFGAYSFLQIFERAFNVKTVLGIFAQGFGAGIIGILFGIFILKILKNEEIEVVTQTLHKKIFRTNSAVVVSEITKID